MHVNKHVNALTVCEVMAVRSTEQSLHFQLHLSLLIGDWKTESSNNQGLAVTRQVSNISQYMLRPLTFLLGHYHHGLIGFWRAVLRPSGWIKCYNSQLIHRTCWTSAGTIIQFVTLRWAVGFTRTPNCLTEERESRWCDHKSTIAPATTPDLLWLCVGWDDARDMA